jgi:CheY-like chemotaxis protein
MHAMKNPLSIFLIDDDEDDCTFFREAMRQIDPVATCTTARDGITALNHLETCKTLPDYIFLDINMPRMDGRQCLREIKHDQRLKSIPVIVYSTSEPSREAPELIAQGAVEYIQKPVFLHEIIVAIAKVLHYPIPDLSLG